MTAEHRALTVIREAHDQAVLIYGRNAILFESDNILATYIEKALTQLESEHAERVRGLVEALEYYAHNENWHMSISDDAPIISGDDMTDEPIQHGGKHAREALAQHASKIQETVLHNYFISQHTAVGETWYNVRPKDFHGLTLGTFNRLEYAKLFIAALVIGVDKVPECEVKENTDD